MTVIHQVRILLWLTHNCLQVLKLGLKEIQRCYSQSVSHQQLYDEPFSFSAKIGKHALLKSHVIVSDVQYRAAIILASKWRYTGETDKRNNSI